MKLQHHTLTFVMLAGGCVIEPPMPGEDETGSTTTTTAGSTSEPASGTSEGATTGTSTDAGTGSTSTAASGSTSTDGTSTDTGTSTAALGSTSTDTGTSTGEGSTGEPPEPECGNMLVEPPELCSAPPVAFFGGPVLTGLVLADFTDDGAQDLAVLSRREVQLSQPATIQILAGDPVSGLVPTSEVFIGDAVSHRGGARPGTVAADFDQDGRTDLAFIDDVHLFMGDQAHLRVWVGQGDATFVESFDHAFDPYMPVYSSVGDFDGDGLVDVATADPFGLVVWPGIGNGLLGPASAITPPAGVTWMRAADLDDDGLTDLMVDTPAPGSSVLLAQPGGGFMTVPVAFCSEADLEHDVDGDGNVDLVCRSTSALTVHLGVGDGTFAAPLVTMFVEANLRFPTGAMGDFDADGTLDAAATIANDVYVAPGLGDGTFGPIALLHATPGSDTIPPTAGIGFDFDADGVDDLVRSQNTVVSTFELFLLLSTP